MANVTRSSFVKAMVKDSYQYGMESYDKEPKVFNQLFDVVGTDAAYEQYTSAIGPGKMTEVIEGASIPRQSAQEGYTVYIANKKYPTELPLTNEAIDDNQKIANYLKEWASGLGESTANAQEETHAALFNYGGYTSGNSAFDNSIPGILTPSYGNFVYDGKPFFALSGNDHRAKNGSTYFNSKASLTLSGSGLEEMMKLIKITNAYNEAGMQVSIMPDVLVVQAGSTNSFIAKRLLESTGDVDGAHAGITNIWKGSLRLVEWRWLTDEDAWFLGKAKKGLKSLTRMPLTIDYYEDKSTDSQIVRARQRWGRGVTNCRYWVGANLSTS